MSGGKVYDTGCFALYMAKGCPFSQGCSGCHPQKCWRLEHFDHRKNKLLHICFAFTPTYRHRGNWPLLPTSLQTTPLKKVVDDYDVWSGSACPYFCWMWTLSFIVPQFKKDTAAPGLPCQQHSQSVHRDIHRRWH